jgi:5'-nucleotidase
VDTQTNSVRDVSARQEVMVPGTWPADPALDAYLVKARERSTAALAQPIATLAVPSVKREKDHARESALGDLVADSMLNAGRPFGAQIALQNPGGIRQDLETASGNRVTLGHAMAVLPFGNSLVAMNLRGAQIVDLLEEQWAGGRDAKRGLLQVSEGFWYEWDPAQPKAAGSCRAA